MKNRAKLWVFEGPDDVGKSTLARRFVQHLRNRNVDCAYITFPGSDPGTLGEHVYSLHHDRGRFGITSITPTALQSLHISAHIDGIERRIRPLLQAGTTVVLDRYWWSTYVYGIASGANTKAIEALIKGEIASWGEILPDAVILVERDAPLNHETTPFWQRCVELYEGLARDESHYPVHRLRNDTTVERAFEALTSSTTPAA